MTQGLFADDSVTRRVNSEGVLGLGGGRALLMQLAHPAVAEGVANHSDFETDPFGRLRRTIEAETTLVFGTVEEAYATAARIRAVHERVTGAGYQANDPELLLWVHATLVDTALRVYTRFVRPLRRNEAEAYYDESTRLAELLGVPRHRLPGDYAEFRSYVREMVATLEVSDVARELARKIFRESAPWVVSPAFALAEQITVGLLPRPLRVQYGFRWDRPRKAVLLAAGAVSRATLPWVPPPVRHAVVALS